MNSTDELKALREKIAQLEKENASLKERLDSEENFTDQSGLAVNALSENEIKFKTIFENSNDGIILIDSRGVILDWNYRIAKVTGLPREQAVNKYVWEIQFSFVPEDQKKAITLDFLKMAWEKEVLSQPVNHTVSGYGEIISRSGKEEFIEDFVKPVTIGNERYYIVFQRYLTEQKKTEHLLMESEEKFRGIFDLSPVPIVLTRTRNQAYTDVNRAFEELTGYTKNEILGRTHSQLGFFMVQEEQQDLPGLLQKTPEISTYPLRLKNKDGVFIDVICSTTVIKMQDENYYLSILYNISDLKAAENSLKEKMDELALVNAELEQYVYANQELKQFAYIASHQLQEPIRTVSNYMNVIEEDYSSVLDANMKRYIGIVKDATSRMSGLINTLLEYSRIGRDRKLVHVDSKTVVKSVLTDLHYLIDGANARVDIGELPSLTLYEVEFRQLLQNLIINAVKFRKENRDPIVAIDSEKTDGIWKFSVSDNGIGIDPLHYDKIFEIFQRLHAHEAEYEGKGVGLAFCKKIVQLHNGEIWVESTPGEGSVFYFTIPEFSIKQ
jgi:PAS domain S-box-containing protein